MKKTILLMAGLIIFGLNAISQNVYNLVIFSEDGEPFFAFVNGIRQNDKPETNIKITDLNSEALNVRIEFENKALPKLKQNMMPEYGYEHTVNLKKNKKMEMKMRYFGKVALAEAPKSSATAIQYHTAENPSGTTGNSQYNTSTSVGTGGGDQTTVTTTSTSTSINSNPGNVSVNVNLGGVGMNVNINDPTLGNGNMTTTSSSTVTTSSSSSSSSSGSYNGNSNVNSSSTQAASSPGSNYGCTSALNTASYDKMKASIDAKPFSDTKMSTAKVATKNACLSVAQVKGICGLFSMDEDKLTYAKFAYDYCVDKANYYQVAEIFSFSSTTDELNKFLESR